MVSRYKDPIQAAHLNDQWAQELQQLSGLWLQPHTLTTDWGQTRVWIHTPLRRVYETLVFLPGFNASSLVWLVGQGITSLSKNYRLCLVDINGQPGFSEGMSPKTGTDEYGQWARQVLEQLGTSRVTLIGHALGALIGLKACRLAPQLVKKAILVNPAGLQSLSLSSVLLRFYLLALRGPSYASVQAFLREVVFSSLDPPLPPAQEKLLIDFQLYTLGSFTLAPWWRQALAREELEAVQTPLYLVLGTQDKLYPYQATLTRATHHLPSLVSVTVLPTMGHSIQRSPVFFPALRAILSQ
jgi:pimeloyl-ACP methyl ester carboxylesterase